MINKLPKYFTALVLLFGGGSILFSQTLTNDSNTANFFGKKTELKLKTKHSSITDNEKSKVSILKTGLITGISIGAGVWLHNYQRNAWWSGQRGHFHIQNDWDYAMSADKYGHFFDGAFIHKLYSGAFEWAGFDKKSSMWLGTLFSIAYMTDIEIEDGFATNWGFSWGDELCNVAGAFYPVLQYYSPPLKEFNFKWSYLPSEELRAGSKNGAFLDDYNGQTVWLSIGIHHFLPKNAKKYWPDFLNIALGYGVKHYTDPVNKYQNYYIAFDYDFRKLIPGNSKFMVWMKDILNHFRIFPAPGIRFNKKGVEYIINF